MPVFLRQDLVTRLVHERYEAGFDGLAARWESLAAVRPGFPKSRGRASIYRWLEEGVPTTGKDAGLQAFGLCALLDIDLLTIFDYERNGYFTRFAKLRQLIYARSSAVGGLATFMAMYRPGDNWPSDAVAQVCYGRRWFTSVFTNEDAWQSTDYVLVKARFLHKVGSQPRAVHIAYRRVLVPDTMWRYYGTVLAVDGHLKLYNESGGYQQMQQVDDNEIRFRTYYGGRPVEWRIASLHEFSVDRELPFNDMDTIGFNW
ncbi:MAG: hypothetical protein ACKVP3_07985 [Hyphomicrobiaceae bacterium]